MQFFKHKIWSKYTPKRTKLYHLKKFSFPPSKARRFVPRDTYRKRDVYFTPVLSPPCLNMDLCPCPRTPLAMHMASPCAACRFATYANSKIEKKKILGPPPPKSWGRPWTHPPPPPLSTPLLMCNHKIVINIMLCFWNSTVVEPRFHTRRAIIVHGTNNNSRACSNVIVYFEIYVLCLSDNI